MKSQKIFFILSILGILFLIVLSQTSNQFQTGIIKSVKYSNNKITIYLENESVELILFDIIILNLKKGDIIEFQGKRDIYRGKKQIIVDKIFMQNDFNKS